MSFHVYPDPQTAPLTVLAGATSALTPIVGPTGLDDTVSEPGIDPSGFATTTFIRIVMMGAAPAAGKEPSVILKAGTGTETEITVLNTKANPKPIPDGASPEVADAIRYPADAANVFLVKVFVYTVPSWQIRIKNNETVGSRQFTWVVADGLVESRQPWIDIAPPPLPPGSTSHFDAVPGQTPRPSVAVSVANKGTGTLNIADAIGTAVGAPQFTLSAVPGGVAPNGTAALIVEFNAPAAIGETTGSAYDVTSNDTTAQTLAGHNRRITLKGTTHKFEIALLLDASGSMAYTPNGDPPPPSETSSRWGKLKEAAKQFLDLLSTLGNGKGRFGVARFPGTNPSSDISSPSSGDIFGANDISSGNVATAKSNLDLHHPGGWTPMGHGIGRVLGTTPSSFGYFLGPDTAAQKPVTFDLRYLVLMTDGAHNSPPLSASPKPQDFYGAGAISFKGKKVKVLTVGYGEPGLSAFEVNHGLLHDIASQSGGQFFDAGIDDAGLDLKKKFRTAITFGLSLDPTIDPGGVLTTGAPEVRRTVAVTPYDTTVAFVVNWSTFDQKRVSVELITPTCDVITPASAVVDTNIFYSGHPTYAIYSVNHDYLRNAADPTRPRYGAWTLIITGNGIGAGESAASEPYDYEVITQSRLKLALTTDHATYNAGDTIKVTGALTLDGKGVAHAAVTLEVEFPGDSSNNWLARNKVTAQEYRSAAAHLAGEDVSAIGIKAYALGQKAITFAPHTRTTLIQMTDPEDRGVYTATFDVTATPGTYDLHVTAVGQTADGVAFRREQRLDLHLDVRPLPIFTLFEVDYRRVIEDDHRTLLASVRVTPRDRFGNVVLVDPEIDPRVALTVEGGEFAGPLVGNLDGTYTRSFRYSTGVTPVVGFQVAGEAIIPGRRLAAVDRLHYADQMVAFEAGGEAESGANQHADPRAALGDITEKQGETFASLGAFGTLTVGFAAQAILAQGDDDVTVFVQPDELLRAYLVEALPYGGRKSWTALGTSPGTTDSFSLARAGLQAASAIRITDRSGRTRGSDFQPSHMPGVSILCVGARHVGAPPAPEALDCLSRIRRFIEDAGRWLSRLIAGAKTR